MKDYIAKWESRSGKHWVKLDRITLDDGRIFYGYASPSAGGGLAATSEPDAIVELERKIAIGYFQPDANKTPMHRVSDYQPEYDV